MKSSMAVTLFVCGTVLFVCGTVLIVLPFVHTAIIMQRMTGTMAALNEVPSYNYALPKYAAIACMLSGIVMILVGAIGGLRSDRSD